MTLHNLGIAVLAVGFIVVGGCSGSSENPTDSDVFMDYVPADLVVTDDLDNDATSGDIQSDQGVADLATADDGIDSVHDAGVDTGAEIHMPVECGRITGTDPFGVRMRGYSEFIEVTEDGLGDSLGWHEVFIDLYFPQGRVAGAPILAAAQGFCPNGVRVSQAILDAKNGAEFTLDGYSLRKHIAFNGSFAGDLVESFKVSYNVSESTSPRNGVAAVDFCNMGTLTDPVLSLDTMQTHRGGTVWYASSVPVSVDDIVVNASINGVTNDVDVVVVNGRIGVTSKSLFSSGGELMVDFTGTTDVVGRELSSDENAVIIATSAYVTDLTFAEQPPSGSIVGNSWEVKDGVFSTLLNSRDPAVTVISLGALTPSTVNIGMSLKCLDMAATTRIDLVSKAGVVDSFTPGCANVYNDQALQVKVSGEYLLVITHVPFEICPQEKPPRSDENTVYIDQITIQ